MNEYMIIIELSDVHPGAQLADSESSSHLSRRANELGIDPSSSLGFVDDIVIGGECGLADGGKASGVQAPTSDNWQHSFTVSSPHPIPSSTNPESLPNRFLNLRNSPVPEALRNKVSNHLSLKL
ncbi:3',5'-cyclic-nucleotide phosphodiesterase [Puccinia graminis f. sp. tritici]|uniref:3',5'-cyclic-nucleotide phosphodiesterase n=1 Tax=Puccinia graminis f. sp. tritici TaxID=56615 RepID=A0A5B0MGA5_PUCGR|nr:3',5'-cyclic-nucleotide phosphodiesterase [Puccinia graminis f. sp. tritici]